MHGRRGAYMHVALSDQDPLYEELLRGPRAALPGLTRREAAGAGVRVISTPRDEAGGGRGGGGGPGSSHGVMAAR